MPRDAMLRSATALCVTAALTACGGTDGDTSAERSPTPSPTTTSTSTPTETGSPTGTASPTATPTDGSTTEARVAAVLGDGRAVVLDRDSGEVQTVLVEDVPVDDPAANDIELSPDRETVYVVRPGQQGADSEIVRVAADGGEPEVLAPGQSPAVSPDGGTLAYVRVVEEEPAGFSPTLRLRDLSSGEERVIETGEQDFYGIWDLAWTQTGEHLVFTAGEVQQGVHALPRDASSLDDHRRLGPEDLDASWDAVATLDGSTVAVVERCCRLPDPDPERWRVIAVDVAGGQVGEPVLPPDAADASDVDGRYDRRGLLVVERQGAQGGSLLHWDGEGQPRRLADDVIVAAW